MWRLGGNLRVRRGNLWSRFPNDFCRSCSLVFRLRPCRSFGFRQRLRVFCISPATLSLVYFASDLVALVRLYFGSDLVALVPSGFVSDVPCFCTDAYSDVVAHPVEPQRLSRFTCLCTPQEPQLHIATLSLTQSSLSDPIASSVSALLKSISCI